MVSLNGFNMLKRFSFLMIIIACIGTATAFETHSKLWTSAVINGSFGEHNRFKYYLEPNLRFIDNRYKFSQALFWAGLGYHIAPEISIYVGDAFDTTRTSSGDDRQFNILWQQVNALFYDGMLIDVDGRTRLEETKRYSQAQWAVTLRQDIDFVIPIKQWEGHAIVLSDEVFFGLKQPDWQRGRHFVRQNRAYAGINTVLTPTSSIDIGYLNQYLFTNPDEMSHIFVVSVSFNFDKDV